jgi:hypothetical protein
MKNSPIASILLGVLTVCVAASVYLCIVQIIGLRKSRDANAYLMNVQAQRIGYSSLFNDLVEYSKTHKDMEPILEAAGITNRPTAR